MEITNNTLFITLDNISPLASPKVNMWSLDNKYDYPPFLRFKFKNISFNHNLYNKIKELIEEFEGCLKWVLLCKEDKTTNYFIIAKPFADYILNDNLKLDKDYLCKIIGELEYHKLIDKAIEDIPNLAKYLEVSFSFGTDL